MTESIETFGQLLSKVQEAEWYNWRARDLGAKVDSLQKGTSGAFYALQASEHQSKAGQLLHWIDQQPGVARIQAICESISGQFNAETLRKVRGQLCLRLSVEPDDVDAFALAEFADAWGKETPDGVQSGVSATDAPLLQQIDELIRFAKEHSGQPLNVDELQRLKHLDAEFYAECIDCGLPLPDVCDSKNLLPYGKCKLPHYRARRTTFDVDAIAAGIPLQIFPSPTEDWEQAMLGLRALAMRKAGSTKVNEETGQLADDRDLQGFNSEVEKTLEPRHRKILDALLELNATSRDRRRNADEIAQVAIDKLATADAVKTEMAELKRHGFVDSKTGRGGGSWLTEMGIETAKQ